MTTHVIERLRAMVAARPDACAVACAGEPALTYRALWDRATAVAERLVAERVGANDIVALHVEKSPELVIGMLATWLAGAAWVPVLPELPDARRQLILEETGARLALVGSDRSLPGCLSIDLSLRQTGAAVVERARSIEDRAYVIYTSGSTGQPKGVVVSHRGLVPMLDAQIAAFELRPGDRCLWMLSPGFDASISDVGTALLAGATLHIEHPARLRSAGDLLELIRRRGITHVDLPPSLLPLLPVEPPPSLRTIIVGGEVCAPAAIRAWVPHVRVINVYGPTEATVCTSLIGCDASWDRPLLGAPLPHVEYAVFDDELWITGPGVADGYLARPELDAAKFVWRDDRRWFRTGDRVHERSPDLGVDNLEFVGRIDRQLKIAGVLVAPEEIEARLREHPAVRDAHVVAERVGNRERLVAYYVGVDELADPAPAGIESGSIPPEPAGSVVAGQRLVAYVGADNPADATSDSMGTGSTPPESPRSVLADARATTAERQALREHLARSLDARLIPSQFTRVETLGSTKRAVASLPRGPSIPDSSGPSRRSRNEGVLDANDSTSENQLHAIWWRLLGIEPDFDDDFFDLGGDSLAVIEHVGLAELAGLPMTADMLYEHRTLRAVATAIERGDGARALTCDELRDDAFQLSRSAVPTTSAASGAHDAVATSCVTAASNVAATSDVAATSAAAGTSAAAAATSAAAATTRVPARSGTSRASILLTGVTGFLGSHVLVELLARTDGPITCLVRDPARLEPALREVVDRDRVRLVIGDLEHLPAELHADTIIHCAADVSLAKPYHALRATNAVGTARILERGTRVHYASTLSVFVGGERTGLHRETDALETAGRVHGGYAQSKWVAEWLARDAGATIYRFGLLTGETRTGRAPSRDWLTWFIRGIARIGAVPRAHELRVDITPIDHAARALAQLALDDARGTFHVANRRSATLAELVSAIRRAGIAIEEVDPARWPAIVSAAQLDTPTLAASVLGLCRGTDRYARARACDVFQATDHTFDTTRVDELVGPCPPPSPELLDRYIAFALTT